MIRMRVMVPLMGLFPHRLRAKSCPHIRLRARPSMDHPLEHPFPSGTRWPLPDSTLTFQYHRASKPCTVISSHESPHHAHKGPQCIAAGVSFAPLLYTAVALDTFYLPRRCRAGCDLLYDQNINICARLFSFLFLSLRHDNYTSVYYTSCTCQRFFKYTRMPKTGRLRRPL